MGLNTIKKIGAYPVENGLSIELKIVNISEALPPRLPNIVE